jgi:hypothetical protein
MEAGCGRKRGVCSRREIIFNIEYPVMNVDLFDNENRENADLFGNGD